MALSQAFVGTTSTGSSSLALASNKMYAKVVTVAADSLIASIEVRLNTTDNEVVAVRGVLYDDNAGAPGKIVSVVDAANDQMEFNGVDRWLSFPVGYYTAAGGDFWIAVHAPDPHSLAVAYETSGGNDQQINSGSAWTIDPAASGGSITDPGSHLYSLRASIISGLVDSQVGTTSVGGSWLTMTNGTVYLRSVALIADTCLSAVVSHIRQQVANVPTLRAVVFDDNAGAPGKLRFQGTTSATSLLMSTAARWFHYPVGLWIPTNATYWIGLQMVGGTSIDISYATSGGDGGTLSAVNDAGTWTSGDDLYSIYGMMIL